MKVLLILPAFNEEANILKAVNQIEQYKKTSNLLLDYVIINDGSTDRTKEVITANKLNAVTLICNLGIGGAVQTGYKYALNNGYDIAIQFDGDGQHDITSIPTLIDPLVRGEANLVVGSRFIDKKSSGFQTSGMRRFGITIISFFIKLVTGKKVYDTTSGFRAADSEAIKIFVQRYPIKYPEPESLVYLLKKRKRITEVPVNMFEREAGESSITPVKSIRYMIEVCMAILISGLMKEQD